MAAAQRVRRCTRRLWRLHRVPPRWSCVIGPSTSARDADLVPASKTLRWPRQPSVPISVGMHRWDCSPRHRGWQWLRSVICTSTARVVRISGESPWPIASMPPTNPAAWFYQQPITLEDHQASRWIAEPLRLLDCCQESDGGQALVVTSVERARDLANAPAVVQAVAQGTGVDQHMMTSFYREDIAQLPEMGVVARQLWAGSGLTQSDIQMAILYDHFTPYVLMQLEEFGFCGRGEAKDFIRDGAIELGGRLPLNTHGGQLGEAYIHGMNGIAEGVRQVRGSAVNQVAAVEHVLVTAGTGVPTSGLILGVDR